MFPTCSIQVCYRLVIGFCPYFFHVFPCFFNVYSCLCHLYHRFLFQLCIRNFYNIFFHVSNILMFCNSLNMFMIKFLPCFRGFETCLLKKNSYSKGMFHMIFRINIITVVTKLKYFTQCSWMFKGNLKLTFKLSRNTQLPWEEHHNGITKCRSTKMCLK
jgi:hypothetical protein